ncbi:hypothetical protein KC19_9G161200 [Ceratodon purpureus]|uniref:Uncharacterized protein n=1 Tax=Ceratodon purpureus TaxID=3225 RepID=A0A8T0H0G0_CERPU|nr:hypothetical protein KC19_9G161200 [Ceratodon purpureus]
MRRHSVYGHPEWAKHKSPWRHGRHLYGILSSGILSALAPPVLACTILATFVTIFNHLIKVGRLSQSIPILEVDTLPFTLTSSVLSLLLVFRTNSSYNRFDEARKLWGSNVNRTRDLARQGLTWIRNPADAAKLACLLRHIKAYPFCLKDHLTEDFTLRDELELLVEPQELEAIMSAGHRPNYVLQVLSMLLDQCSISEWEKMAMDANLTTFHDNVGGCERILKTPIPVAYTLLTSRFLILWHLILPFALWSSCRWLTIPATFSTAAALFYIEQVGVMIEEPFWILPLQSICTGIVSALDSLSAAHKGAALLWSFHQPSKDHVVQITFESSRSDGFRNNRDEVNRVVLTRMNSIA